MGQQITPTRLDSDYTHTPIPCLSGKKYKRRSLIQGIIRRLTHNTGPGEGKATGWLVQEPSPSPGPGQSPWILPTNKGRGTKKTGREKTTACRERNSPGRIPSRRRLSFSDLSL